MSMGESKIKVSVIVPIYNMEAYISECLDSILGQSLKKIEIICIDDASTDRSWDILSEYSQRNKNVVLIKQEKEGPGVARNKGIQKASGIYVCMMDADDYYSDPFVLEKLYSISEKNSTTVCGGNIVDEYPDGKRLPSPGNFDTDGFHDSRIEPRLYGQTRFLYKRDFLINNNLSYLPYVRYEDPPFVLKTILKAGKYYTISDYVYVRRAGYKKPKTSYSIAVGVLNGILECMKTAREYDLVEFYHENMENLLEGCIVYIHPFIWEGDVCLWNLIRNINMIPDGWTDRRRFFPSSKEEYHEYINGRLAVKERCKEAKSVILYGAGKMAEKLFEYEWISTDRIEGVVVTTKKTDSKYKGFVIKEISEYAGYNGDALFVLAGSEKNTMEMENQIERLHIKNYLVATSNIAAFVEDICDAEMNI